MMAFREPFEGDWAKIGRLADEAVSHIDGAPKQADWLRSRKQFIGSRRHFVAELDTKIVGYGSAEAGKTASEQGARLFLVVSWSGPEARKIADAVFGRLCQDAAAMQVSHVWMREYADDEPFVEFLLARGFEVEGEYTHEGMRLVNLSCNDLTRACRSL